VPSVASPVGVNRDIIANGENGFLAATEQEWYERLETLCRQPQLRARMGQAGRRTVEEQYSLAVWGPRLGDVYRTLAGNEHVNEIHRAVHSPVSGHRTTGTR